MEKLETDRNICKTHKLTKTNFIKPVSSSKEQPGI